MVAHGVDPYSLDAVDLLDVSWRLAVDSVPLGLFGETFLTRDRVASMLAGEWDEPPVYDPVLHAESWGATDDAVRATEKLMADAGGAAPLREHDEVPESVRRAREQAALRYPELLDR